MQNVVIYSPDFSLCYSLLMYLQSHYKVVATTDINVVSSLIESNSTDLVIMDVEPTNEIKLRCEGYRKTNTEVPIILTYVFNNRIKDSERKIKNLITDIFYKPFDLNEISSRIPQLLSHAH